MNISEIQALIETLINSQQTPPKEFASPQILVGGITKQGLSATDIAREIIQRKQEIGIPIDNLPDGSESLDEKMERIRVEVILKHLFLNAKITVAIPAGIPVQATGTAVGGTAVVAGTTINNAKGYGIIQ